jgi:hypothetical protein
MIMPELDLELLKEMKKKIDDIERLATELETMGKGTPAVKKNALCILSFTQALKYGISDVAEIWD